MLPSFQQIRRGTFSTRTPWTVVAKMDSNDQMFQPNYYPNTSPQVTSSTSPVSHVMSDVLYDTDIEYNSFVNPAYHPPYPPPVPLQQVMSVSGNPSVIPEHQMPPTEKELARMRRQEQNRRSQKDFRMRKEQKIKELQAQLEQTTKDYKNLSEETAGLRTERTHLEAEIERLIEENRRLRTSIESSPSAEMPWMPNESNSGSSGHNLPGQSRQMQR